MVAFGPADPVTPPLAQVVEREFLGRFFNQETEQRLHGAWYFGYEKLEGFQKVSQPAGQRLQLQGDRALLWLVDCW